MQTQLNIITALPSEARPLIDHYGLRRQTAVRGITLYASEGLRLAVAGVGKTASAYGVGVLAGMAADDAAQIWVNVGIAGHRDAPLGSAGLAHRIDDLASARVHYPAIVFTAPCPTYRVSCFDQPTTDYDGDALCDMESAAFFSAAARSANVEFIHVLKIVSDNSAEHLAAINRQTISDLVAAQLDVVDALLERLRNVAAAGLPATPPHPPGVNLGEQWRFSVTQSLQLKELERRWLVLRPTEQWPPVSLADCRDARDVIAQLRAVVDAVTLDLDAP